MPTIVDVARLAGVSTATVSNAFSGRRPVAPETRDRVQAVAKRLGYRPNHVAASMVTGRTRTIGVVVPDISNPFFSELVRAAENAAGSRGYMTLVASSELDAALEDRYVDVMHDKRVDALLYLPGTGRLPAGLGGILAADTPLVVLDEALPSAPAGASIITTDNERGGEIVARHLLDLGHRHIGVIGGPRSLPTSRQRLAGFRRGLRRAGIPLERSRARHAAAYTRADGAEAARRLLAQDARITALFCANDLIALGALEAARGIRRAVPGDLSIAGFDDIFVSELVSPSLTTVRQPIGRLGKEAAELAIDLIEGRATGPQRQLLPVELVVRESTGAAPLGRGLGVGTLAARA